MDCVLYRGQYKQEGWEHKILNAVTISHHQISANHKT